MPTEYGSPIYRGHQPASDAACVALSRQAGGILMGKTVTTEFANVSPGKTRHPRDPQRTPGGSSSGSAAAVSAGRVALAGGARAAHVARVLLWHCGVSSHVWASALCRGQRGGRVVRYAGADGTEYRRHRS